MLKIKEVDDFFFKRDHKKKKKIYRTKLVIYGEGKDVNSFENIYNP